MVSYWPHPATNNDTCGTGKKEIIGYTSACFFLEVLKRMEEKMILSPDHIYKVGVDIPFGYYMFSNALINSNGRASPVLRNAELHMYEQYPPESWHRYDSGYWGVTYVYQEQKYLRIENGYGQFYGTEPFSLYNTLSTVDMESGEYINDGIAIINNELCDIRIYWRDKLQHLFHGDVDAELSDQYIFSINSHMFWASILDVKSYRSYSSVVFCLNESSTGKRYKYGENGLRLKGNMNAYKADDDPLRLYRVGKYDFFVLELPQKAERCALFLEWIKPSSASKKLLPSELSIQIQYRDSLAALADMLQKYCEIGIHIDIDKELLLFTNAPDFIAPCLSFLKATIDEKPIVESRSGNSRKLLTFHVGASYDKKFYCAAKLADYANIVQSNSENTVYYVSFSEEKTEEISLMYFNLVSAFNADKDYMVAIKEYLITYDFATFLQNKIDKFISELREKWGYSGVVTNSVLVSINKAINRNRRQKLNKLYTAMVEEKRANTRWSTEYKLFSIISKLIDDVHYQYRTEWLGLQSYDIFIPSQNIAIEYQGQQHYEAIDVFGGEKAFADNKKRDERKRLLSAEHGVKVLYWKYDMYVNIDNVTRFLMENNVEHHLNQEQSDEFTIEPHNIEMAPIKKPELKPRVKTPSKKSVDAYVIRKYSIKGEFLLEYSSVSEAAQENSISEKVISNVIYGIRKTGGGFIWRRSQRDSDIEKIAPTVIAESMGVSKAVRQIGADGEIKASYPSIGQASKQTGINRRSISDALVGIQNTAGGYIWRYEENKN